MSKKPASKKPDIDMVRKMMGGGERRRAVQYVRNLKLSGNALDAVLDEFPGFRDLYNELN